MAGVISITTNRGRALAVNTTQFTVRNEAGRDYADDWFQSPLAHPYRVNAAGQYVNAAGVVVTRDQRVVQPNGIAENPFIVPTYDHADQVFRPGTVNTQTASLQHNSAATNYRLSYSRNQQPGVVLENNGYSRQLLRFNIDQRWSDKLRVSLSAAHVEAKDDPALLSIANLARIDADVDLLARDSTGQYRYAAETQPFTIANPLASLTLTKAGTARKRTLLNLGATYNVNSWLAFDAVGSYDRGYQNQTIRSSSALATLPRSEQATQRHDSTAEGQFIGGVVATRTLGKLTGRLSAREEIRREAGADERLQWRRFSCREPERSSRYHDVLLCGIAHVSRATCECHVCKS